MDRRGFVKAAIIAPFMIKKSFADAGCPEEKQSPHGTKLIAKNLFRDLEGPAYTERDGTAHTLNELDTDTLDDIKGWAEALKGNHVRRSKALINKAYKRGKRQAGKQFDRVAHKAGVDRAISVIEKAHQSVEDAVSNAFSKFGYEPDRSLTVKQSVNEALNQAVAEGRNGFTTSLSLATRDDTLFNKNMYHDPDKVREAVLDALEAAKESEVLNLNSVETALESAAEKDMQPILKAIQAAKECKPSPVSAPAATLV